MTKAIRFKLLAFLILFSNLLFSQAGGYYNSISTSSPTFIQDLKARIRSPYYQVYYSQYDETILSNFEARDTLDGKKVITCVYSGENYVYTPPFTWDRFSREHTWCYSWMPTYGSEDGQEYSDQHHLFPTNQDKANGVRSNHPLGKVDSVLSTYLDSKFGLNADKQLVFEPRNAHKGDAARALLYMCIKYDGVNGTWNFNWLNNTSLPKNGEGPEDLAALLQWHRQDPPDKWEVDRNNYIQSVQQNRNPFVDHPEYVNYINFNDLSLQSPQFAVEPSNQVTNLSAASTDSTVTLSWTDALPGNQSPSGYLLMAYSRDNYFIPIDGSVYNDDTDISDGKALVNVAYSGADSYTFKKLKPAAEYYFTIYSYNGQADQINYNTNDTGIRIKAKTTGQPDTKIFFASPAAAAVSESDGTYTLSISITDPSAVNATTADVVLSSGSSADVNNYSTQKVTFPAGSTSPQTVTITITDDTLREPDETLVFSIQNVSGGTNAQAGTSGQFSLTIKDNDNGGSAGGQESFSGFRETSQTYVSGSFTGKDGSTWTYTNCSGAPAVQITSPSPVLKKFDSTKDQALAKVQSGTISGGCGFLSFKYMQAFSTVVNLGVYVNNNLITSVTSAAGETGKVKTAGPFSVNVEGSFTIKLEQMNASSGQVTVDDISWTGYGTNTSVEDNNGNTLPKEFALFQNYPNPFNPATTINYSIPKQSFVTLKIFDLLGREVAVLVSKEQNAGKYSVKFNASSLQSGIYIYSLHAGEFSESKKLMILK